MTKPTKGSDIKRNWHIIDINDQVLGRTATKIAKLLMGKSKSYFVRNLDCGDYVVVTNAKHVKVTGNKTKQKYYFHHTGYPQGDRVIWFEEMLAQKPEEIIIHAVKGMLPQNKLRDSMLKRLYVYPEAEHPYQDKLKAKS
jgi:large subunit ribosomal protein L13